ncbi:hypothetical protein J6590_073174 [Homalodisca vitripennis]|nr:hypothetical protein J6590_073174 [Homalodisca vitripennis]
MPYEVQFFPALFTIRKALWGFNDFRNTTNGRADGLQGQDHSAVTHPSSRHARRCLIWLSSDNRCTRYTAS